MNYFVQFILSITLITLVKTEFIYSCTEKKTIALTVKLIHTNNINNNNIMKIFTKNY